MREGGTLNLCDTIRAFNEIILNELILNEPTTKQADGYRATCKSTCK